MENKTNKYIAVSYKLYVKDENGKHLVEETKEGQPFKFISGFGIALDAFENNIIPKAIDEEFSFVLEKEQAYGEHHDELVLDMEREAFFIDGRFDHEHIYKDAIIPLQNQEGQRFNGRVLEVGDQKVKIDLNHPLAGETLQFEGKVLENRDASENEINQLIKHLTGGCGGCGGGSCGGSCGDCGGGDCDCGNCNG